MWLMTRGGIFMPSVRPAETMEPGDLNFIQVRARRRKDLDWLRANHAPMLGPTIYMPETDYQFRAYCTHDDLAAIMGSLAHDIDYTKFKPTAVDKTLHDIYMEIWYVIYDRLGGYGTFGGWRGRRRGWTPAKQTAQPASGQVSGGYPWEKKSAQPALPAFTTPVDVDAPDLDLTDAEAYEEWLRRNWEPYVERVLPTAEDAALTTDDALELDRTQRRERRGRRRGHGRRHND